MPSIEVFLAFIVATSVFAYMPGPSMLYAAAQSIARGRRAGWFAALGIHLGGYVHVIAAAAGLSVLFQAVPTMYLMLKIAGAAYLIWLGIKIFRGESPVSLDNDRTLPKSPEHAFWESVTVEVLNPKTAIFFVAFLPQFADPNGNLEIWVQLLILGAIVNVMFSSADVLCVALADKVTKLFKSSRSANRIAQKIGGSILVALGANLALDRQ